MGLSQRELSKISGVSREVIRLVENGQRTEVQLTTLQKLSKTFECSISDLVE